MKVHLYPALLYCLLSGRIGRCSPFYVLSNDYEGDVGSQHTQNQSETGLFSWSLKDGPRRHYWAVISAGESEAEVRNYYNVMNQ